MNSINALSLGLARRAAQTARRQRLSGRSEVASLIVGKSPACGVGRHQNFSTTAFSVDEIECTGVIFSASPLLQYQSSTILGNSVALSHQSFTTPSLLSVLAGSSAPALLESVLDSCISALQNLSESIYLISTLKRRRKMMNKHKLRKRRKKNRMKNKK